MKFSEKRELRKRNDFIKNIVTVIDVHGTISIRPKSSGWPNFNRDFLQSIDAELESRKICMFTYIMEDPNKEKDTGTIAWAVFGYSPKAVWEKHLINVGKLIDFVSENKEYDDKNQAQNLVDHTEFCRLDMEKKYKVFLEPFTKVQKDLHKFVLN